MAGANPVAAMAGRILVFIFFPLSRGAGVDTFPASLPTVPTEELRQLQYAPLDDGSAYTQGDVVGNGGYEPNSESGHYIYPGGNYGYTAPTQYAPTADPSQSKRPSLNAKQAAQATEAVSTTRRWRGMVVASSGSDPLHPNSAAVGHSSGSDSSAKTESSQWSSSYSGSGSGWLFPWAYKNLPWVYPYWIWWQYIMTFVTAACFACCLVTFCVCFCHSCSRKKAAKRKPRHHHHHHHHHHAHEDEGDDDEEEEEEDEESSEEDLEEDPLHRGKGRQDSSSSQRPTGSQGRLPPTANHYPQPGHRR